MEDQHNFSQKVIEDIDFTDDNEAFPTSTPTSFTNSSIYESVGQVNTTGFASPSKPLSFMTMATICTNISCKQAVLHLNDTLTTGNEMTGKDASWILTSAVIIFTMQTGMYGPAIWESIRKNILATFSRLVKRYFKFYFMGG